MRPAAVPGRAALLAIWVAAAVALSALLAVARFSRTADDDPDPSRQRPGILDLAPLPEPAPPLEALQPGDGRPDVVFFAAGNRVERLCRALREDGADLDAANIVLVADPRPRGCAQGVHIAEGDLSQLATAFGVPRTRGGVGPTGYAIVDDDGRIRYRTLDPVAPELLDEVGTMLRGLS